jgi:carbon-monoxide dehydrogenase medium subunit
MKGQFAEIKLNLSVVSNKNGALSLIPKEFEYYAPESLNEALSLLATMGAQAKILAGGQSLIPLMKYRLVETPTIIDVNRIRDLSSINEDTNGGLAIGALTRHVTLENSSLIKAKCPVLAQAASLIGDAHIRNRGTIGGSVAHMDPAADYLAVLAALDCNIEVAGTGGTRNVSWKDFFLGMYRTALQPTEMVTRITIPREKISKKGAYLKVARSSGDFSIAGVASVIDISSDGVCAQASIGVGALEDKPGRSAKAENTLVGKPLDLDSIRRAADVAGSEFRGFTDMHATAEYRRSLVRVLTRRTLERAAGIHLW